MEKHMEQKFRLRGYQPADPAAELVTVFGEAPEPTNPDGSVMKKLWDHDHEQHSIVRDHVEPTAG